MPSQQTVATSKKYPLKWHYFKDPDSEPCPTGLVRALTRGGIDVDATGLANRTDAIKRGFIAWCPKPQRDKEVEEKYNVFSPI